MANKNKEAVEAVTLFLKQRSEFYKLIGESISFWSAIENLIFELFCNALSSEIELSKSIFWSIPNFSMRVSYTSALVMIVLKTTDTPSKQHKNNNQKEWDTLNKNIVESYKTRNRIAHQPRSNEVFREMANDGNGKVTVRFEVTDKFAIAPNINDPNQNFETIDIPRMIKYIEEINIIEFNLQRFVVKFREERLLKYPRKYFPS